MSIFGQFVIQIIPAVASIVLWINYIINKETLIAAILLTGYTFLLYLVNRGKTFAGFMEIKEEADGHKLFQLVINQNPDTFKDRDKIIFQCKEVS